LKERLAAASSTPPLCLLSKSKQLAQARKGERRSMQVLIVNVAEMGTPIILASDAGFGYKIF
jgi:hypothetical protein